MSGLLWIGKALAGLLVLSIAILTTISFGCLLMLAWRSITGNESNGFIVDGLLGLIVLGLTVIVVGAALMIGDQVFMLILH